MLPKLLKSCRYLSVVILLSLQGSLAIAAPASKINQTVECDLLIVGGGLAGAGAAYESLLAGKTVCMTEITDWVGGQISSQGTSALDERPTQSKLNFFPRGYIELTNRLRQHYSSPNPGGCWVSSMCFVPRDGHDILFQQLQDAAKKGGGQLKWFPSTVIKELDIQKVGRGKQITSAIAIQHRPAPRTPPLNTEPLSKTIADAYTYNDSDRLQKTVIKFVPASHQTGNQAGWYVIEATETGELIALADVPYRLGVEPRSYLEPSSSSEKGDPYCTQGFTYTFAMERTPEAQKNLMPSFYPQHEPYYSYELKRLADFDFVFAYRRISNPNPGPETSFSGLSYAAPTPGDISMQNWTWGNDYRPGTSQDNLIYTREQLQEGGQLNPGGWLGGLRIETLSQAEDHATGYYYWLVEGTTDSQLGPGVKKPDPRHRYVKGLDSPMGTEHGLSKYPYIRESRHIVGRPSFGYEDGFWITEIDISRINYQQDYYRETLGADEYRRLLGVLSGLEGFNVLDGSLSPDKVKQRTRSTIYPDSVGIGHYAIDFHPCMTLSPPFASGNTEKEGERRGQGAAYPFQIPLRSMIPQGIDNLLVTGKSIAMSHIAGAAYRVHSFEWSSGVAAGKTAAFSLEKNVLPYQLVDKPLLNDPRLRELQSRLIQSGNPIAFPDTSIFNESWQDWK